MCGIVPEMLKAGGEVVVQWLTEFFNMVWRVGVRECSHCPHIYKGQQNGMHKLQRIKCDEYCG